MNNIQIFNNPEFGTVRTVEIDGKTYFVANDVAKALGYAKPANAVAAHCKGILKTGIPSERGMQETNIIPEGDIYRLVIKSQLPSAQKFESWIFDTVLPSIRKNGMYAVDELSPELQAIFAHDKKIQIVEQRVDKLENTMNIDYAQQKQLKNFANEIVVNALGGKDARAYRYRGDDGSKMSSQCFSRFWHDFNDYFNINAYANLPRVRFDEALEYINRWQPPTNMQLEIGRINREIA